MIKLTISELKNLINEQIKKRPFKDRLSNAPEEFHQAINKITNNLRILKNPNSSYGDAIAALVEIAEFHEDATKSLKPKKNFHLDYDDY